MTDAPDNPAAFPVHNTNHRGMTLRDWFAGQALAVFKGSAGPSEHAFWAYELADAMLAVRKAKP